MVRTIGQRYRCLDGLNRLFYIEPIKLQQLQWFTDLISNYIEAIDT
jgi:hypothetical protein